MLNIAMEYHKVVNDITGNKSLKLRQYELDHEGWDIIENLLHVLKVSFTHLSQQTYFNVVSDVQGCDALLFLRHRSYNCSCHPNHGPNRCDAKQFFHQSTFVFY
jgi:hypothetical protein